MRIAAIWAAVALLGGGTSRADTIIDQSYVPVTGQGYNTSFSGNLPIGQTFTPTLGSLNFVDLFLGDAGTDTGPGASFFVRIRFLQIAGEILGTSRAEFLPDGLNTGVSSNADFAVTRFRFADSVALVPGKVAVIEVVQQRPIVTGNSNFLLYGGNLDPDRYPEGKGIVGGRSFPAFDFAFREGIETAAAVPAPPSLVLGGFAVALLSFGGLRRRLG